MPVSMQQFEKEVQVLKDVAKKNPVDVQPLPPVVHNEKYGTLICSLTDGAHDGWWKAKRYTRDNS